MTDPLFQSFNDQTQYMFPLIVFICSQENIVLVIDPNYFRIGLAEQYLHSIRKCELNVKLAIMLCRW